MKQRTLAWIAAMLVLASVCAMCVSATNDTLVMGDLDRNGYIDSRDVRAMAQHIVGRAPLDASKIPQADINGSGRVDTVDMHILLTWLAYGQAATAPTVTTTTTTSATAPTTTTTRPSIDDDGYYDDVVKP